MIFFRVGDTKVASDLIGLAYVSVDPANPTGPRIREEVFRFAERLKDYYFNQSLHSAKRLVAAFARDNPIKNKDNEYKIRL